MHQNEENLQVFNTLHQHIRQAGLLRKKSRYYDWVIARNILMFITIIACAFFVEKFSGLFVFQIPIAIGLGFVFGQFAFLAHDTGHEQITSNIFPLAIIRYFSNVFLYTSLTGWRIKHDLHHLEPNNSMLDPDCHMPMLAFTPEQAKTARGISRFFVKYQPYFFLPIATMTAISMRFTGICFLLRTKHPKTVLELIISAISFVAYVVLWMTLFGINKALIFMITSELAFGLYMGMAFIINHCGRSCEPRVKTDFLIKQVETARNIMSLWKPLDTFIHFVFGGLNCQIEHHLWPYMPRCNLRKAREIVRAYCRQNNIDYHAVSLAQTYKEVFSHFSRISRFVQ